MTIDAKQLADYRDLPEAVREHLAALELFIGDCDGKDCVISNGETAIDDGTIDASDAVKAFNGIVAALRSSTREAVAEWLEVEAAQYGDSDAVVYSPRNVANILSTQATRLRALLPAQRSEGREAWQPIETAPKAKGVCVFGFYPSGCRRVMGWSEQWERWTNLGPDGNQNEQPTRWQPLPAPPAALPTPSEPTTREVKTSDGFIVRTNKDGRILAVLSGPHDEPTTGDNDDAR